MTSTNSATPLKWSAQFTVLPVSATPSLRGDKIILPQTALEQLLSAATTTVAGTDTPFRPDFDPYNPYSVAAERQARSGILERHQNLPHPLTFRLVNPENGRILYAGIREFSAEENRVGISPFLRDALGFSERSFRGGEDGKERLTIHVQELSKGSFVKLRPLEAGYDPEDWKALLERYLRDNFTTLTHGEILTIPAGKDEYRFLVDELKPSNEAVSLVDTDLEVDIEALNEEQARETLKRRLQRSQKAPGNKGESSAGRVVAIDHEISDQVLPGEYVDYTLEEWDRSQDLEVELAGVDDEDDLDLFINPMSPRHRARPRQDEHMFADFSARPSKRIRIRHTNTALDNAEALWVSVRGCQAGGDRSGLLPYHLQITCPASAISSADAETSTDDVPPNPEDIRCKNCHQWVPQRTLFLHENFCLRNNILCPNCSNVFQKSSSAWKEHWHCPHDSAYGSGPSTHTKHDSVFHTAQVCRDCGYEAQNIPDLAHHRTSTCPAKLILCTFCHLLVPQQGPEDPSPSDPEVILSGLTPHELSDGARTTECHLCSKIVRLRDMSTHLKHHDLQRLSRAKPRICRNVNCGRCFDAVTKTGDIIRPRGSGSENELGICDTCFGPLYVSMYDPDGKALRRRVERRYLTQLLTGCGHPFCKNEYCRSGRSNNRSLPQEGKIASKEAMGMIKPVMERLKDALGSTPVHFCTDEASQRRRVLAEMIATEGDAAFEDKKEKERGKGKEDHGGGESPGGGYELEWCVAALEVAAGDLDLARAWLRDCAPTKAESLAR